MLENVLLPKHESDAKEESDHHPKRLCEALLVNARRSSLSPVMTSRAVKQREQLACNGSHKDSCTRRTAVKDSKTCLSDRVLRS
jgi:hypothetical protein